MYERLISFFLIFILISTDIVYSGMLLEEDLQKNYLLDLSAYDFANQYSVSIMNQRDVDGALYMLPGTYSVFSMLYNKSLFEEKGWTAPTTNDEFVALCRQIREETDIIPVTHCGFAVGTYWRMLGALAQSGFLGTSEGVEWTNAFVKGDSSFEAGFGNAIDVMKDRTALANQDSIQPLAIVEENMTHPQTLQTMADLLYEIGTDSAVDVAVVSNGTFIGNVANTTGVSGRLIAGDINSETYIINIPGAANKSLMCLNLTGGELFALLEGGRSVTDGSETAVFDYYWSGMDTEMKDGNIVSAVLPDGTAVKEDESYRVMICTDDYDTAAYPDGEDMGIIVSDAYRAVMDGKTITVPGKICR